MDITGRARMPPIVEYYIVIGLSDLGKSRI